MNKLGSDSFFSSWTPSDHILDMEMLLTHDPDGRHFDSELLLTVVEDILSRMTASQVSCPQFDTSAVHSISNIEIVGSEESVAQTIHRAGLEVIYRSSREWNLHLKTTALFDSLRNYKWDAKVVLLLTAFVTSYAEFWLLRQYPHNPLAELIAVLKRLPTNINSFKSQFKSLNLLMKTMVNVAKCIIDFESLPHSHKGLDRGLIKKTQSQVYKAAYWVARSILVCSSQFRVLIARKPEQVYTISAIAVWEHSSLTFRLSSIYNCLERDLDMCHRQIETFIYQTLLNLSKMTCTDNQELLTTLFASKGESPLKYCPSQAKVGVSDLINKVVIVFITRPELLPLESLLSVIQQTYYHSYNKVIEEKYVIVWIPISVSHTWNDAEKRSFDIFSNNIPWYTIRYPWSLNKAVMKFLKQEWKYEDDPLMVVLDPQGTITNSNALDMVLIWGAQAFPFSRSMEEELWAEEKLSLRLLTDDIDRQLSRLVEEGRKLCIYGSDNFNWIKELNSKTMEARNKGLELEMLYVGAYNTSEKLRSTLAAIDKRKPYMSLPSDKINLFWLRLESMRKSKLRLGKTTATDHILREVSALLDFNYSEKGWIVLGKGPFSNIVTIHGNQVIEVLNSYTHWRKYEADLGFLGAIKAATEPRLLIGPCDHSVVVPYAEPSTEGTIACDKCKLPMKKYVVYE